MSVLVERMPLVEVPFEARTGLDGQGMPSYAPERMISCAPVWEETLVTTTEGTKVTSILTVWVPGSEVTIKLNDRLTVDGFHVIVIGVSAPRNLQTWTRDHACLKCRLE